MPKVLEVKGTYNFMYFKCVMDNKEFARGLEQRTLQFAVRIIRLSVSLPLNAEAQVIKTQISKSGTSVGANYREANRSRSKANFKNKAELGGAQYPFK